MSTNAREELLQLLPEEIVVDDDVNVRLFSSEVGDTEEEIRLIQELADSILASGQIEPVRVRLDQEGKAHLVAGSRRRKAAMVINMSRGEGEEAFRLQAIAEEGEVDRKRALRQAAHENLKRKGLSPMDFARLCARVREEMGWKGKSGTASVAAFLGVSTAQVTQMEKLLKLGADHALMVHDGRMSADAGIKLAEAKPENREQMIADAEVERRNELAKKKAADDAAEAEAAVASKGKKKKPAARDTGKIQKKHLKDPERPEKKTRKEIVDYFALIRDSPAYGFEDGAVRQFAAYFVEKWAEGIGSERTLDKYFDAMVAGADKGTVTKAAASKAETKPKSEPKSPAVDAVAKAVVAAGAKKKAAKKSKSKSKKAA